MRLVVVMVVVVFECYKLGVVELDRVSELSERGKKIVLKSLDETPALFTI